MVTISTSSCKTGSAARPINHSGGKEKIDLGPYEAGTWTNWKFHVKWSYQSDGLVEIWKDGQLVVSKTGPNTYNDRQGPYFKIGIYKPDWKYKPQKSNTTQRVIYFDEVRVENNSSAWTWWNN